MSKRLYVGSLPYAVDTEQLREMFAAYGEVIDARVIDDRMTGKSKGFGFVEMAENADADKAMAALHDTDMGGRKLVVNEAREREERPRSFNNGASGRGGAPTSHYAPSENKEASAPEVSEDAA